MPREKKKKRKRRYVPGLAQLEFRPDHDWEVEEARTLFHETTHPVPVDTIQYEDCIAGLDRLPAASVDLVVADPPFGIEFDGKGSQYNRDSALVSDGYREVDEDYDAFTRAWISRLPRVMKPTASAYIFSGWTNLVDVLVALRRARLPVINHLVWKYQFGVFTRKKFVSSHYHVLFVARDPDQYFFNKYEHYPLDVWEIPRKYRRGQRKNGTKLPEAVVQRCLNFSSRPGDLVLDPFMGNGTTAVCAKKSFRHYHGFEVNPKMREILEANVARVELGAGYRPLRTYLPSIEDLAEKYPGVRRKLQELREQGLPLPRTPKAQARGEPKADEKGAAATKTLLDYTE